MGETPYGVIKAERETDSGFERRFKKDLLVVPHEGQPLTVGLEPFGPDFYDFNVQGMRQSFKHPRKGFVSFRPATTAESASVIAYGIDALPLGGIQLGRALSTRKGVYFNPPTDHWFGPITDEGALEEHLEKAEEIDGLLVVPNGLIEGVRDFSFMPHEDSEIERADPDTFLRGRLARGIEHTTKRRAETLEGPAGLYEGGVNIYGLARELLSEERPFVVCNVTLRPISHGGDNFLSVGLMTDQVQGSLYGVALE